MGLKYEPSSERHRISPGPASERIGDNLAGFKDLCLKMEALTVLDVPHSLDSGTSEILEQCFALKVFRGTDRTVLRACMAYMPSLLTCFPGKNQRCAQMDLWVGNSVGNSDVAGNSDVW